MSALIAGSMAYDTIMVFPDRFKHHILPEQVHILNVAFLVPELRREYGGCAGNIAYNLKLLGGEPQILATVGKDFGPYADWLSSLGISRNHITVRDDYYTAQAYITTDLDDNQITAFHPGAMSLAHETPAPSHAGIEIGLISPDGKEGMLLHAEQFHQMGLPFIFDPGQGLPMFEGHDLLNLIEKADWVTLNDYEAKLMQDRTSCSIEDLASRVKALIVTQGGKGSIIHTAGKILEIPPAPVLKTADPTGCGDAYRAGLVYGLLEGHDLETTGRIASLMGAIKVESPGTQNHGFTRDGFRNRFKESFGYSLD